MIFYNHQTLKEKWVNNRSAHQLLVDVKKSITQNEVFYNAVTKSGTPTKLFRLIKLSSHGIRYKYTFYMLSVQNGLKYRNTLLSLLSNFSREYTVTKVHEDQKRIKLNRIYLLLVYADDI
jgi:hypothetical protein